MTVSASPPRAARAVKPAERDGPARQVRPVRDDDAQDLFGLLALCFAEHPGCFVDPHDDLSDLRAPGSAFAGGAFWAVEDARGRIAACVAVTLPDPRAADPRAADRGTADRGTADRGAAELHRLYVRPDARRRGLGAHLVGLAEERAREHGARRVVLWSDTRFTDAHRLYERLGYERLSGTRELGDISGSVEFAYAKALP